MGKLLSRRKFVGFTGAAYLSLPWAITRPVAAHAMQAVSPTADAVLKDLMDGNARFASGQISSPRRSPTDFSALAEVQRPEAVVIACSDSRVPPEILFDQGVGDLFVIRVAGNVVNGAGAVVKGSIEYAVAELNVPLIVVLGHSNCGAVKAAVKHIDDRDALPGAINDLVGLIKPAVERSNGEPGDKLENAIRANVAIGVERLKTLEPILAEPVQTGRVKIVGATYDLRSGRVKLVA
ncbi:MAG: carbonic anhydrase [Pirellulales bacterium]